MITKLLQKAVMPLLLLLVLSATQNVNAQCTNPNVVPTGFTAVGWSPTCNNGTDGFIRITGISSTVNRPYTVRLLDVATGNLLTPTAQIPVTTFNIGNATSFDIPNLPAGSYKYDIETACGDNTGDFSVTLGNPALNSLQPLDTTIISSLLRFKDTKTVCPNPPNCGNYLVFDYLR